MLEQYGMIWIMYIRTSMMYNWNSCKKSIKKNYKTCNFVENKLFWFFFQNYFVHFFLLFYCTIYCTEFVNRVLERGQRDVISDGLIKPNGLSG